MITTFIGFMGCGKSSVGRKLSELLCCPFIDLDQVIEKRAGRTITEIFSQDGEPAFRQMELVALKQVIGEGSTGSLILALGGGTVMMEECAENVRSQTKCIYLRASIDTLMEHLEGQTGNRPLLNTPDCHSDRVNQDQESALRDRIADLMAKRSSTYEKTADIIIDIDGKSIEEVSSEIISILG